MLSGQLPNGELNPARITSQFTDPLKQREVAQLFNTALHVDNLQEQEKAISETIKKVMEHTIEQRTQQLDPTDIAGLQKLIDAKKRLQELGRLHISL